MKLLTALTILGFALGQGAFCQTLPIYINDRDFTGSVPPQIDATTFVNQALFSITTSPLPFETQNTLYFTNKGSGVMSGSVGFRFNYYSPTSGVSAPADTFVNQGRITGDPYLIISATNIVNTGLLFSGAGGLLHLDGSKINLATSGLRTGETLDTTIIIGGDGRNIASNYYNAAGVTDYWWGVGTNNSLGTNGRPVVIATVLTTNIYFPEIGFDIPYTLSPSHQVQQILYGRLNTNIVQVPYFGLLGALPGLGNYGNYTAVVYTNKPFGGDLHISIVYYPTNNITTNFTTTVRFYPDFSGGSVAVVEFALVDFDIVLQSNIYSYVYLIDSSAITTNFMLFRNLRVNTRRPNVYELTRTTPYEFILGSPPNAPFTNSLIYNPSYETNVVNVKYAGYAALLNETNMLSSPIVISPTGGVAANPAITDPTNSIGRIEIESDSLDLRNTRIRAEKFISIKTKNLINNKMGAVDAPIVNYDIGSTNRILELSNLVVSTVNRLSGAVVAYSAVWTNRTIDLVTNLVFTNGVFSNIVSTVTNTIHFHILMVDNLLSGTKPVVVHQLAARATNVVIYDNLIVAKSVLVESDGLQIARSGAGIGGLTLPINSDWSSASFPILRSLTNDGYISMSGVGYFYNQVLTNQTNAIFPYTTLINSGSITGASFIVYTTNLLNSGTWGAASGVMSLNVDSGRLANGQMSSKSDFVINAREFVLSNATIQAGVDSRGALIINVTNKLSDGGAGTVTRVRVSDGFQLLRRPTVGDLLYTEIESKIERFAEVTHIWAGENRGVSTAGFYNNAALGRLILDAADLTQIKFRGVGTNDALYVDYIEFRNFATNYNSIISIDTNLTIYFANANLPVGKLNGAFGGRMKWVPTFTGPNSTTLVSLPNGQIAAYNTALLTSPDLDSDRDGIPNLFDSTPVLTDSDIALNVVSITPTRSAVSWNAPRRSTNRLEYATNITGTWYTLTNFVQSDVKSRITVLDTATNALMRFYRVRVDMTIP